VEIGRDRGTVLGDAEHEPQDDVGFFCGWGEVHNEAVCHLPVAAWVIFRNFRGNNRRTTETLFA
jgi:hypothetical protein